MKMDKNGYDYLSRINKLARKKICRVGVVVFNANKDSENYLKKANKIVDVVVIGSKIKGLECYDIKDEKLAGEKVIKLLDDKSIDALVRGQLHPRPLFFPLCQKMGKGELAYFDGSMRVNALIFENKKTKRFFILTGVDLMSDVTFEQKMTEVKKMIKYTKDIGIKPYVAIMTMRRSKPKDAKPIKGLKEFSIIEENYQHMEKIYNEFKKDQKIKIGMFNIEYETAVEAGANLIIPPIGPVGNAFARSLCFFSGDWELISAQALQFRPYIIQEGFKTANGKAFYNHIIAAAADVNSNSKI